MEALTIIILKSVASSCIKYYVAALLASSQISYDKGDLGYKIPKWYMNPGRAKKEFYSYGTSVKGDEFESLGDAKEKAIAQMLEVMRASNAKIVGEKIKYDSSNVKQKRMIELFLRGDTLDDFIRINAKQDKKQLVKVKMPSEDMRAFVRLSLAAKDYNEHQLKELTELKSKLMRQKSDDILSEIDEEVKRLKISPWENLEKAMAVQAADDTSSPSDERPKAENNGGKSSVDSAFDELDGEVGK